MNANSDIFGRLAERLERGESFALRMQMDGEGRFKDFQGVHEIETLKEFLEHAEELSFADINFRDASAKDSVIWEGGI